LRRPTKVTVGWVSTAGYASLDTCRSLRFSRRNLLDQLISKNVL
jgi:hypothetical protein